MNEKQAKRIRKAVYKDISLKVARKYITNNGTIINAPGSLRSVYKKTKNKLK